MPNNVIQTPCTQANKKILNIRKNQSLGKCFCEFSIQICASSLDVLPENYFKIQKIHHKTLRIIYQSDDSYENLLNLDNSVSLHERHLGFLVTEIFKSVNKTNPKFMWSNFSSKNLSYNLRKGSFLSLPSAKSSLYGTNYVC